MEAQVIWTPGVTLDALERQVIVNAYQAFGRNKTATANALGISVRTLDSKLEVFEAETRREIEYHESQKQREIEFLARCRGTRPEIVNEEPKPFGVEAKKGDDMESVTKLTAQHAVSMSKRPEIQKVSPGKTAKSG